MIDYLSETLSNEFNLFFLVFMLILAFGDMVTYFKDNAANHKSFQGLITGVGILGTFLGISLALYNFNVSDISGSVPQLLNGMKIAFFTSVCGMAISIFINLVQTIFVKRFAKTGNTLEDKITEQTKLFVGIFDSIQKTNQANEEQVKLLRSESRDQGEKTNSVLESKLSQMNRSLEDALEKLSEGANKQIIEALNDVIKDFNTKLEDSFGGNLGRLSDGVDNLLEWQKNYSSSIEEFEYGLKQAIGSLSSTEKQLVDIASYQQKFITMTTEIESSIIAGSNLITINKELASEFNSVLVKLKENTEGLSNIPQEFDAVINKAKESAALIEQTYADSNTKLNTQMDSSVKEAEKLKNQMGEATNVLNRSLMTLTTEFAKKYGEFLQAAERLMIK